MILGSLWKGHCYNHKYEYNATIKFELLINLKKFPSMQNCKTSPFRIIPGPGVIRLR